MKTRPCAGAGNIEILESRRMLSAGGHDHDGAAFVHETDLVTSGNAGSVPAVNTDSTMINPWGLASSSTSPFWVSDNGTGVSTLYNGSGVRQGTPFVIPPATGSTTSAPTGQVFAGGDGFIPDPTRPADTAVFIFVGEDGGITAWNPAFGHNAFMAVNNGNTDPSLNAVYKGVTIGDVGATHFLYAANFRTGQVEVYDTSFKPVTMPGGFVDHHVPKGFAPFNIQSVGGNLFVTYAKQDDARHDDVAGPGNGFVDEFNTQGVLLQRFDHGGFLNSPWGVAQAPSDGAWGDLGGDILVGQFGSGHIDAFAPDGDFRGFLHDDVTGKRVTIDGLWALRFGNGAAAGPVDTLFFTAGTAGESAGLFGSLTSSSAPATLGDHDHDHDHRGDDHGDDGGDRHGHDGDKDAGDSSAARLVDDAMNR
jgi:uncharacterized protein (TIGR03118 family)